MGRIVVSEFMSLDGVIEDPGGAEGFEHGGWSFAFDTGTSSPRRWASPSGATPPRCGATSPRRGDGVAVLTYEPVPVT